MVDPGRDSFDEQNGRFVTKWYTSNFPISQPETKSNRVGITRVEFIINGALQCTDTTAPFSCNWNVPNTRNQTYQLQARGFDQAGNMGTSTIQVTSR